GVLLVQPRDIPRRFFLALRVRVPVVVDAPVLPSKLSYVRFLPLDRRSRVQWLPDLGCRVFQDWSGNLPAPLVRLGILSFQLVGSPLYRRESGNAVSSLRVWHWIGCK